MDSSDAQCIICHRPNSVEANMVQCDGCSRWYHFSCAGVGDSIADADKSYRCALCKRRDSHTASSSKSTTSTTASQREARLQLEMQRLAEEKALQAKLMAERAKQDQEIQEKALLLEKDRREKAIADLMKLEQEFLDRKYKLLHAQLDADDRSSVVSNGSDKAVDKVRGWINNHPVILGTKTGESVPTGLTTQTGVLVETQPTSAAAGLAHGKIISNNVAITKTCSKSPDIVMSPIPNREEGHLGQRNMSSTPRAVPAPPLMVNWAMLHHLLVGYQ